MCGVVQPGFEFLIRNEEIALKTLMQICSSLGISTLFRQIRKCYKIKLVLVRGIFISRRG